MERGSLTSGIKTREANQRKNTPHIDDTYSLVQTELKLVGLELAYVINFIIRDCVHLTCHDRMSSFHIIACK